jgi:HK97 family phage prohead protease
MATFILNSEEINSKGFRIKTSGIDFEDFRKNPVMLWNHSINDVRRLPIGKWDNIRVEGNLLLGDAVFDEGDVFAVEIERKVKEGFIKACSITVMYPKDAKLEDETSVYINRCRLIEASLVDVPSNPEALIISASKVNYVGTEPDMSLEMMQYVSLGVKLLKNNNKMDRIKAILKMDASSDEDAIIAELTDILSRQDELEALSLTQKEMIDRLSVDYGILQGELSKLHQKQVQALCEEGVSLGIFNTEGSQKFASLCALDEDLGQDFFRCLKQNFKNGKKDDGGSSAPSDSRKPVVEGLGVAPRYNATASTTLQYESMGWDELDRKGLLSKLYREDTSLYERMYRERFGVQE